LPPIESVRAFLFESYNGIVIHRGVWHGKMFPLEEKFAYMMASRVQTTDDALNPLYDSDVQIRDLGTTFELLL
jgi:ureidoglycolate lyase